MRNRTEKQVIDAEAKFEIVEKKVEEREDKIKEMKVVMPNEEKTFSKKEIEENDLRLNANKKMKKFFFQILL